jgi:dipeptidyl aminopeptidase/acylaminoacyl peptidase
MFSVRHTALILCTAALLSACGSATYQQPRVELPQEFRMPQNEIVTIFERRVGRIAVMAEDGNILVMDQTGGAVVPITRDANLSEQSDEILAYRLPVWSPDAKQIAMVELASRRVDRNMYVELNPEAVLIQRGADSAVIEQTAEGSVTRRPESGSTYVERRPRRVIIERASKDESFIYSALYVASADGRLPMREVFLSRTHEIDYIDWAPDSAQIAFLARHRARQTASLNVVDIHSSARPRKLWEGLSVFWHWHPDGKTMIARLGSARGNADRLALIDAAGDQIARLASGSLAFRTPHFSPDGGYMLLTEPIKDERHKLVLADRNGKPIRTLVEFKGRISFAWSPAGAKVAYVVQSDAELPGGPLVVMDVNSGSRRVISNKPVVAFFWSPDGQRIASFSRASATDITPAFKGFDFTPPLDIPYMLLETINPEDGNARGLFYFAPTQAFQQLAAEFDRYSRAVTIWSPDSRKLVFTLTFGDANGTRDFVLETEASGSINPRVIGRGPLAFWSPR